MSDVKKWSTIASENDKTPPDGWPENMAPSDVNNSARENMAAIKRAYVQSPYMSPGGTVVYVNGTTITIADDDLNTDYSQFYTAQRRIKVLSPTGDKYGLVTSSSYSAGVTTVVLQMDGGVDVPSDLTDVMLGIEYNDIANVAGPNMLGMVLPYTADPSNVPTGFLLADGDYFNPTIYSALADLYDTGEKDESGNIIYLHGGGYNNGVWWPKKPDVRGKFPRFLDNRASTDDTKIDPDAPRTVGSDQDWSYAALSGHVWNLESTQTPVADGKLFKPEGGTAGNGAGGSGGRHKYAGFFFDVAGLYPDNTSTENRPVNMAFPGLLVAYGGYASASGIKVEDLLTLTIAAATEQINTALADMEETIGDLETEVTTAISTLDDRTAEKVAQLNAIVSAAEEDIDASVALAQQYADQAAAVTVGKQNALKSGTYMLHANNWVTSTYIEYELTVQGVTETSFVWVSPATDASRELYIASNVRCVSLETNKVVFRCDTVPSEGIIVTVVFADKM